MKIKIARSLNNSYLRSPKFITLCVTHTGSILSRSYFTALWSAYFKPILILPPHLGELCVSGNIGYKEGDF